MVKKERIIIDETDVLKIQENFDNHFDELIKNLEEYLKKQDGVE